MEIFNIWDLERVHIRINESFLDRINKGIHLKFGNKAKCYYSLFESNELSYSTFKNILKKSTMRYFFIPLDVYLKVVDALQISRQEFQSNILAYKTAGGPNFIDSPILPIVITPVFHMLFAHNIGDGTVINPKNGRLPYFGYRQFDEFYRVAYVRKIESIFGKINYKNNNYYLKSTRPYCPPVLSSLFFKYYNVRMEDFLSTEARIPNFILNQDKEEILSILIGFIIDEGYIDSTQITIGLKNKLLIEDLGKICSVLGYNYTVSHTEKKDYIDYGYLSILRKGMKSLYLDYLLLNKKYPVIDLGWKGERILKSFKIYNRPIKKTKGNQNMIYSILQNEFLSVNQLADRISMTRQGVRYHIHNLLKQGKIKLIDDSQLNWLYGA